MTARQKALAAALAPYADRSGDPHSLIDAVRDGAARACDVWEPLLRALVESVENLGITSSTEVQAALDAAKSALRTTT